VNLQEGRVYQRKQNGRTSVLQKVIRKSVAEGWEVVF
jgi:hypothetical protein